jgi:hypothetical protein
VGLSLLHFKEYNNNYNLFRTHYQQTQDKKVLLQEGIDKVKGLYNQSFSQAQKKLENNLQKYSPPQPVK